ncbi:hypothetical protein GH714_029271 [Hevea brasiliensis]|uniref:Retrovirus-related Pol polyprotein from transposon TNT 1-94-like beta-barrel domain-containing protein n=1 Tax=Hevea brasiliensis TaxID=3981 RepID=A0A6A6LFZ0_HEVBR|nr:hypothetical protein GH714_029271 [Hevea brasiliensis]
MISDLHIGMVTELNMATTTKSNDWWYDSGATVHVCNDKTQFKNYEEVVNGQKVLMGNHDSAKVVGKGSVELNFTSGKKLLLVNVLYVPEIRKNLVSASLLCKKGYKAVLESDKIIVSINGLFVGKGKNYVNWIGPQPQLIITELQLVKEILNNKDEYPKPEFKSFTKKIFGDGLLRARGEKWFRQRKLANHAFHGENLKGMIPAMIASVEMMLERWRQHEGKEIEVNKEFKILTSEIISRTAFGSSHLEGQHIFEMLSRLVLLLSINAYKVRIPGLEKIVKTKDEIESDKLEQDVRDSTLKMIRKREEEVKKGEADSYGSDYFGVLLKANQEADKTKKISIDDIVDECKTFYVAGH